METIKEKLRKIAALAERGVGGERDNAKRLLESLLAKHGFSIEEIMGQEQERQEHWFPARTKLEQDILCQCYFCVTNTVKAKCWFGRGPRKGQMCFRLTKLEALELQAMWDHFGPLWRREIRRMLAENKRRMELLTGAFINKHGLYNSTPGERDDEHEPLSPKDLLQLMSLMAGLEDTKYVGTRRMLEGTRREGG